MGMRWALAGAVALMCAWGVGCTHESSEAEQRLAATKAQGDELLARLDGVEERLLGNQASVKLWNEMAWRHKRVSAIACENLAGHVAGMEKFIAQQESKTRKVRKYRVAQSDVASAKVKGRRAREN